MTSVTFRNSSDVKTKEVTYVYDVFDRRIAKDVDTDGNGAIDRGERYVYDNGGKLDPNAGVSLDDVVLVFDEADVLLERLLYGPGIDQPLAAEDASGEVLWLLADQQGTITVIAFASSSGASRLSFPGPQLSTTLEGSSEPAMTQTDTLMNFLRALPLREQ